MLEGGFTTGGPEDIELKKGICSNYLFIYFFLLTTTNSLNSYYEAGVNLIASKQVVSSNLGVFVGFLIELWLPPKGETHAS